MSVYQVEKICYRLVHDPAFREALLRDPDATIEPLPLTDEERDLLLRGEVGRLYELGTHPYLLSHISRVQAFGVTTEHYREKMKGVRPEQ